MSAQWTLSIFAVSKKRDEIVSAFKGKIGGDVGEGGRRGRNLLACFAIRER